MSSSWAAGDFRAAVAALKGAVTRAAQEGGMHVRVLDEANLIDAANGEDWPPPRVLAVMGTVMGIRYLHVARELMAANPTPMWRQAKPTAPLGQGQGQGQGQGAGDPEQRLRRAADITPPQPHAPWDVPPNLERMQRIYNAAQGILAMLHLLQRDGCPTWTQLALLERGTRLRIRVFAAPSPMPMVRGSDRTVASQRSRVRSVPIPASPTAQANGYLPADQRDTLPTSQPGHAPGRPQRPAGPSYPSRQTPQQMPQQLPSDVETDEQVSTVLSSPGYHTAPPPPSWAEQQENLRLYGSQYPQQPPQPYMPSNQPPQRQPYPQARAAGERYYADGTPVDRTTAPEAIAPGETDPHDRDTTRGGAFRWRRR